MGTDRRETRGAEETLSGVERVDATGSDVCTSEGAGQSVIGTHSECRAQ